MEQSSAGVAVAAKNQGTSNGDRKAQLQPRGRPTAAWPGTEFKNLNIHRRWQTSADALGGDIRLDDGARIFALLEVAGRNVWGLSNPGSCRPKQGVAVFDRLGPQMTETAQATRSQITEPPRHFLEMMLFPPLSLRPSIRRPRRHDHQPRNRGPVVVWPDVRSQEHMRMVTGAVRATIGFVAGEESGYVAGVVTRERHEGTAQMMNERGPVFKGDSMLTIQVKGEYVRAVRNRLHQPETAESAIPDHQRAGERFLEVKLHMPQGMLGESGSVSEPLGSHPPPLKRLPLHLDYRRPGQNAGMSERLHDGTRRSSFLLASFIRGLLPQYAVNAATGRPGQRKRRHASERA